MVSMRASCYLVVLLVGVSLLANLPTAQSSCADDIVDTVKKKIQGHVKVDHRLNDKGDKMCGRKDAFKKNTDAGTLHGEIADAILSCYASIQKAQTRSKRQTSGTSTTIDATDTLKYTSATYCPFKNVSLPTCNKSAIYRSNDGSCNNLQSPFYGNDYTNIQAFDVSMSSSFLMFYLFCC